MGGLALKSVYTRRYDKAEFEAISQELLGILRTDFMRAELPLYYNNKETFGDADIILSMENFKMNMRTYIEDTFKPNEIFHNGNCWSFDYKELQVDLITCAGDDFDSNFHYLAFNDLGNFQGALTHQFKFTLHIDGVTIDFILKYGQEELFIKSYAKSKSFDKYVLSKDFPKIFEFLNLNYDRWLIGFDELEDIFEFISNSKYFSRELYQLSNLNRINRERNEKRASYMKFLSWVDKFIGTDKEFKQHYDSQFVINKLEHAFGDELSKFKIFLTEQVRLFKETKEVNEKFNGHIIMDKYNIKGKELGLAIRCFKDNLNCDFNTYILSTNVDEIFNKFEEIL